MAVRNLDAINRYGKMIAEQTRNAKQLKEDAFWNRVEIIKKCHDDAIDAIDTIDALSKNGLRGKFDGWMKMQNVSYSHYQQRFEVSCKVDTPSKESAYVSYYPLQDGVNFSWSGWGMCESYNTAKIDMEYFIHTYLKNHGYDDGLTKLAERLQPFLNAFFKWVDSL